MNSGSTPRSCGSQWSQGTFVIELTGLGTFDLRIDRRPLSSLTVQPKRVGLLVYLHLARPPGAHRRDTLLSMFWPEHDEAHARQSLNQALYSLRRTLGQDAIRSRGRDQVELVQDVMVSDVSAFEDALEAGDRERALALYRGDLLPGFYLTGCDEFERWLDDARGRLRHRAIAVARDLIATLEAKWDSTPALHWARWARLTAPLDEGFLLAQLRLLAGRGDQEAIASEYRAYVSRLSAELGLEPSTTALKAYEAAMQKAAKEDSFREPVAKDAATGPVTPSRAAALPGPRHRLAKALMVAVVIIAMAWYTSARIPDARGAPSLDRRRILVMPVEYGADSSLVATAHLAADRMASVLARSGLVRVVTPVVAGATRGNPARLASQAGAGLMVAASIHPSAPRREGTSAMLEAVITETSTGRIVGRVEPTAIDVAAPAAGLTEFGSRVTGSVVMAADFALGDWTATGSQPPDLESYRLFAAGLDAMRNDGGLAEADSLFLRAAGRDSSFTTPLVWAIRARTDAHRHLAADSLARRLRPLRPQMKGADGAMYDYYAAYLWSSWEEAYQAARRMAEIVPTADWKRLAAGAALPANRPGDALTILNETERDQGSWIRDWPLRWRTWAMAYHAVGRYGDEHRLAKEWEHRDPGYARVAEFNSLAGLGRWTELAAVLERQLEEVGGSRARLRVLGNAEQEIRAHGGAVHADRYGEMLIALVDSIRGLDTSFPARFERARLRTQVGRYAEAYELLDEGVGPPDLAGYVEKAILGIAAAGVGQEDEARALARQLTVEPPLVSGTMTMWAARILAVLGDREGGTDLFRLAIERGHGFYPWLHTVREFESLRDYPPFQALIKPLN